MEYENDNFINPFRKIKIRFKEPQTLPMVMTLNEVKKIFDILYKELNNNTKIENYTYLSQVRNIAIIELLFATGMRISELCNLKISDIDLKTGIIKIFGKGSKERIIQICNPDIKSLLKKYRKLCDNHTNKDGCFFLNRLNRPVSTQSVRLMLHQYVSKSGISKNVTPHTYRHTFATLLLEENVDVRYIQNYVKDENPVKTQIQRGKLYHRRPVYRRQILL
jgi:integrase/recombinase XerD